MTAYQWLLALHILSIVVWVGGNLTIQILATRIRASHEPVRMAAMGGDAEWVGMRVFLPASILAVISGVSLVLNGNWGWNHFWIGFGIFGFLFSAIVGSAFLGPESGRIKTLIESEGPNSSAVQARTDRVFLISRIELVILFLVVADMALKPGS
jgi:uncharacterized membrane protein